MAATIAVPPGRVEPGSNGQTKKPPRRGTSRTWFVIAGLVVAVAIGVALLVTMRPATGIQASGTIEVTRTDVSPKVGGRIVALRVHDGDRVRAGQAVATLEQRDPALGLDQARANVAAASAQVDAARAAYDLQRQTYAATLAQARSGVGIAGSRVGQAGATLDIETRAAALAIDQARAQLGAAQAANHRANVDLVRARSLVASGDQPQRMLDDAIAAYANTGAQVTAARDGVALATAQARNVEVRRLDVDTSQLQHLQSRSTLAAAQAEEQLVTQRGAQLAAAEGVLAQARAAAGLAQDQLRETQLRAPFDGYVISHNFEVGELVQPGSAVLTIGDLAAPYLYVYVSESDLPRIKTGMPADVTIDGLPGKTFVGTITEISNTAEFTPENVQTKEQRIQYLVFRVKLQFADRTGSLKPGLPADAVIRV